MSIHMLITDDHAIVREGLSRILGAMAGVEVVGEAADGAEALLKIASLDPDVVLMDISMPGMSGIDLIGRIHAEHPRLPVLVLSMHKEGQFAVRAFKIGAAGYLTKDCAPEQLERAIRRVAAGGKYISSEVADALANAVLPSRMGAPHERLSNREFQVFRMLVSGQPINEIAQELSLSANTISTHKHRLMNKLGTENSASLVRYALTHQVIP